MGFSNPPMARTPTRRSAAARLTKSWTTCCARNRRKSARPDFLKNRAGESLRRQQLRFVTWGVCVFSVVAARARSERGLVVRSSVDAHWTRNGPDAVPQARVLRVANPRSVARAATTLNGYWGVAAGWFEDAPLALTVVARASRPCDGCTIRTGGTPVPLPVLHLPGSQRDFCSLSSKPLHG